MVDQHFHNKLLGDEVHWSKFGPQEDPAQPLSDLPTSSLLGSVAQGCPYSQEQINRFESKIKILDGGCWEWTGIKHSKKNPIGRFIVGGKGKYEGANRASYKMFRGPIEESQWVVRIPECDLPGCCNPLHLELKSSRKAHLNAQERGTFKPVLSVSQPNSHVDGFKPTLIGSQVHGSKLQVKDVLEIRIAHSKGDVSYAALGRQYKVDTQAIRRIVIGEHWKYLPMDIEECQKRLAIAKESVEPDFNIGIGHYGSFMGRGESNG